MFYLSDPLLWSPPPPCPPSPPPQIRSTSLGQERARGPSTTAGRAREEDTSRPPILSPLRLLRRLGAPPSDGSKSDPVIGSPGIGPHRGVNVAGYRVSRNPPRQRVLYSGDSHTSHPRGWVTRRAPRNRPTGCSTMGRGKAAHPTQLQSAPRSRNGGCHIHLQYSSSHARSSWAIESRKLQRDD